MDVSSSYPQVINPMDEFINALFHARDTAHHLHLKTKSFAKHLALNDLYDQLVDHADNIAEPYQGKYGLLTASSVMMSFDQVCPNTFIAQLADYVEDARKNLPQDSYLQSEIDVLQSDIYRAKYKLDNLA